MAYPATRRQSTPCRCWSSRPVSSRLRTRCAATICLARLTKSTKHGCQSVSRCDGTHVSSADSELVLVPGFVKCGVGFCTWPGFARASCRAERSNTMQYGRRRLCEGIHIPCMTSQYKTICRYLPSLFFFYWDGRRRGRHMLPR